MSHLTRGDEWSIKIFNCSESFTFATFVPKGHYSVIPKIKFLFFFIINYIISEVVLNCKAVAIDQNHKFADFGEEN